MLLTAGGEGGRPGAVLLAVPPVGPGQDVSLGAGVGDLLSRVEQDLTAAHTAPGGLSRVATLGACRTPRSVNYFETFLFYSILYLIARAALDRAGHDH